MNPYRIPVPCPADLAGHVAQPRPPGDWFPVIIVTWAFMVAAVACVRPTTTHAQAAAEGAYGAALLKCVDEANTLAESKACRARVDAEWGVTVVGKDGGR